MDSFWAKYIFFELKKYRGVIFQETEKEYKIWRGINPHEKINRCLNDINRCLTDTFKI